MATLPTWLTSPFGGISNVLASGVQAGSQIARNQLAQEQLAQEAALARERLVAAAQQNAIENASRMALAQLSQLGRQEALNQSIKEFESQQALVQSKEERLAREAMARMEAQNSLKRDIESGVDPRQAYLKYAPLIDPTTISSAIPEEKKPVYGKPGETFDLPNLPGYKGVWTSGAQAQLIKDPNFKAPPTELEKARLDKVKADIKRVEESMKELSIADREILKEAVKNIYQDKDVIEGKKDPLPEIEKIRNFLKGSGSKRISTIEELETLPSGSEFDWVYPDGRVRHGKKK